MSISSYPTCVHRVHRWGLTLWRQNKVKPIHIAMRKVILMMMCLLASAGMLMAQEQTKGYRGFAELGYGIGVGDYEFGRFSIETSHGYQFNHYFFLGAGMGFQFSSKYETPGMEYALDKRDSKVDIPIFANVHLNFLKKKLSPFIDLKGGAYVNNGGGAYVNASAGLRIATTARQAVNISVGYAFQQLEFETFGRFTNPGHNMNYTRDARRLDAEAVTIKVGYEF